MELWKKTALGLVTITTFIFLAIVLVFVYAAASKGESVPSIFQPFLDYHIEFMMVMGVLGVGSGLSSYAIISSTMEKQKKATKTNIEIIMKFLGNEEREILALLARKEGMTTQSEIARLPNMSRLKAHRVVKKLEGRGIVHVEKYGKVNMVRVVEELKNS